MRNGRYWLSALLTLLGSTARGDGLGGAIGVSTDNVFRGLSQSDGQPSAQAELHYAETQWAAGLSAESVRGDRDERLGPELTAFAGYQQTWADDLGASVTLRHYDYPTFARRYDELAASVLWRTTIRATVTASPDTPSPRSHRYDPSGAYGMGGGDWAFSYEVEARVPLPRPLPLGLYADAGVGYYDVSRQAGYGYGYGSVGLGYPWRSWDLDLRYVGTDQRARLLFGERASARLLLTVLWTW